MYFNVTNSKLHLRPKWSKIKIQKIFNLCFEYKKLESCGRERWTDDGYFTGYSRAPNHSWELQAHSQGNPISGAALPYWEQWFCWCHPHKTSSSSTQSLGVGYPIHIQRFMLQDGFFPGISYSPSANSTKSRMQAQSSAWAMLWLHTAHTAAAPGILTPLPKPAKGMREKLVAWKKKEQHLELLSGTEEIILYAAGDMKHFPPNQNHSGGPW